MTITIDKDTLTPIIADVKFELLEAADERSEP